MNTTNMPGFTAEDSLYKTSGHYRTGRNRGAINLAAQMNGTIHSAVTREDIVIDIVGEEVITVVGTAPAPEWWVSGGGGGVTGPLGGGPVPSGESGGGGGGGGGGSGDPSSAAPIPPRENPKGNNDGCTPAQIQSEEAQFCMKKLEQDLMNNDPHPHYHRCRGTTMECCKNYENRVTVCQKLS